MVDNKGQTFDFMLSKHRNKAATRRFFKRAIGSNGEPDWVVIDKSGANLASLESVNVILKFTGSGSIIKILQVKYLNNIVEQGVVAWSMRRSERALPETDFRRCVRTWGGQVQSSG